MQNELQQGNDILLKRFSFKHATPSHSRSYDVRFCFLIVMTFDTIKDNFLVLKGGYACI